jgi:histidyl-tRNA synthetase
LTTYDSDRAMPGVGMSIGLTRLFSQFKEKGIFENKPNTSAEVLIVPLIGDITEPLKIATNLRRKSIKVETILENKPLKKKLNFANKRNFEFVVMVGEDEIRDQKFTLKNMKSGEQKKISIDEIADLILSVRSKNI